MTLDIRHVVTGHVENGTAVIARNGKAENDRVSKASGLTSTLRWVDSLRL